MILIHLLTWGTIIFCVYCVIQRLWWMWLDHLTLKFTEEWEGLDYPRYDLDINRNLTEIELVYRVKHSVIYYPFVYKGRYVEIITSRYSHRKWGSDIPGLREQIIVLN